MTREKIEKLFGEKLDGEIKFEEKEGEIEPDDLYESWGKFWHDTAWWLNFFIHKW